MYWFSYDFTCYLPRRCRHGTGDIATPPIRSSVRHVTFSFRTVTRRKHIDVFSRRYVHHVMGVCCIVFDIDGMLFEFVMNFLNISCFLPVLCYFQHVKKKKIGVKKILKKCPGGGRFLFALLTQKNALIRLLYISFSFHFLICYFQH